MKVITRVFVFSAAFALGAVAGSLFSTSTVQFPYPNLQVDEKQPSYKKACRYRN
jgi:hypothetical protein